MCKVIDWHVDTRKRGFLHANNSILVLFSPEVLWTIFLFSFWRGKKERDHRGSYLARASQSMIFFYCSYCSTFVNDFKRRFAFEDAALRTLNSERCHGMHCNDRWCTCSSWWVLELVEDTAVLYRMRMLYFFIWSYYSPLKLPVTALDFALPTQNIIANLDISRLAPFYSLRHKKQHGCVADSLEVDRGHERSGSRAGAYWIESMHPQDRGHAPSGLTNCTHWTKDMHYITLRSPSVCSSYARRPWDMRNLGRVIYLRAHNYGLFFLADSYSPFNCMWWALCILSRASYSYFSSCRTIECSHIAEIAALWCCTEYRCFPEDEMSRRHTPHYDQL